MRVWDESAWNAKLQEARHLLALGDEGGFIRAALLAFNQRPQRPEPLYDLARYCRERGMNDASVLFSEPGLAVKRPNQAASSIEEFVYTAGLREEFSIAANYSHDPERKDRGFAACNWLALSREAPPGPRNLARHNLRFYAEPFENTMPSFARRQLGFTPPDGYRPMNPSVTRLGGELALAVRCVSYTLSEDGQYRWPKDKPHTRNFLLRLNEELETQSSKEIILPSNWPKADLGVETAFADLRPFAWRGEIWCIGHFLELTATGLAQQVLARIDESEPELCRLVDWRVLRPDARAQHEKNWMPLVDGESLRFIYLCDPTRLVDDEARTLSETEPTIAAEQFRGGSQAIEFDGGRLCLVHEALHGGPSQWRIYHHRFVWFDGENVLRGASRPFVFHKQGIEFAAGLAWHPDKRHLTVSYGVADREAYIATVEADDVRRILDDTEQLPSGLHGETSGARFNRRSFG